MTSLIFALAVSIPAQQPAIAVMPLGTKTLDANKVSVLDNLVVTAVSEIGAYRVISASDINAILGLEKMKDAAGCSDLGCAANIGGALGADFLFTGTADVLGTSLILTAALLDIKKSEAVARKKLRISNDENDYYDAVEDLVAMTFGLQSSAGTRTKTGAPILTKAPDGGQIKVTTDAPGQIFLDGRDTGYSTPYALSGVPKGRHTITVVGPGKRGKGEVEVEPHGSHSLHISWQEDVTGNIRVDASVPGATVSFDGRTIGDVPQLISDVPTGKHTVTVSALGFKKWQEDVEIPADATLDITATLIERRSHSIGPRFFLRFGTWSEVDCEDPDDSGVCDSSDAFNVGVALDYRWSHSDNLALKLRLGIGTLDVMTGEWDGDDQMIGLLGVSEVFTIPLVHSDDPMATVAPHPFAINFSGGAEVVVGGPLIIRALATLGFQLWWLYADFTIGGQFAADQDYEDANEQKQTSLDIMVMGFDAGLTFSF